jgi:hypothetical protein
LKKCIIGRNSSCVLTGRKRGEITAVKLLKVLIILVASPALTGFANPHGPAGRIGGFGTG